MKNFLIKSIRFYQKNISPLKKPCCRFVPSCSDYALEAVSKHGAIKGGLMAFTRFLKCTPFFKGGYDPVKDKKSLENKGFRRAISCIWKKIKL